MLWYWTSIFLNFYNVFTKVTKISISYFCLFWNLCNILTTRCWFCRLSRYSIEVYDNASTLEFKAKCVCVQNNLAYFPFIHCPLVANQKTRWYINTRSLFYSLLKWHCVVLCTFHSIMWSIFVKFAFSLVLQIICTYYLLVMFSVTRLGNLLDFGQLFKAFGSN